MRRFGESAAAAANSQASGASPQGITGSQRNAPAAPQFGKAALPSLRSRSSDTAASRLLERRRQLPATSSASPTVEIFTASMPQHAAHTASTAEPSQPLAARGRADGSGGGGGDRGASAPASRQGSSGPPPSFVARMEAYSLKREAAEKEAAAEAAASAASTAAVAKAELSRKRQQQQQHHHPMPSARSVSLQPRVASAEPPKPQPLVRGPAATATSSSSSSAMAVAAASGPAGHRSRHRSSSMGGEDAHASSVSSGGVWALVAARRAAAVAAVTRPAAADGPSVDSADAVVVLLPRHRGGAALVDSHPAAAAAVASEGEARARAGGGRGRSFGSPTIDIYVPRAVPAAGAVSREASSAYAHHIDSTSDLFVDALGGSGGDDDDNLPLLEQPVSPTPASSPPSRPTAAATAGTSAAVAAAAEAAAPSYGALYRSGAALAGHEATQDGRAWQLFDPGTTSGGGRQHEPLHGIDCVVGGGGDGVALTRAAPRGAFRFSKSAAERKRAASGAAAAADTVFESLDGPTKPLLRAASFSTGPCLCVSDDVSWGQWGAHTAPHGVCLCELLLCLLHRHVVFAWCWARQRTPLGRAGAGEDKHPSAGCPRGRGAHPLAERAAGTPSPAPADDDGRSFICIIYYSQGNEWRRRRRYASPLPHPCVDPIGAPGERSGHTGGCAGRRCPPALLNCALPRASALPHPGRSARAGGGGQAGHAARPVPPHGRGSARAADQAAVRVGSPPVAAAGPGDHFWGDHCGSCHWAAGGYTETRGFHGWEAAAEG